MKRERDLLLAKYLRGIAKYTLLVVFSLTFVFALLSGSGDYGGGIKGIIQNSTNSAPWLIFLVLLFVAWKWELIGGILITLLGFGALYFFCFPWKGLESAFYLSLFIIIFGSLFIISWFLRRKANNHRE
jgi:hypothetical protein